jgi:thiol:disulfide interchange protein
MAPTDGSIRVRSASQRAIPVLLIAIAIALVAARVASRLMAPPPSTEQLVQWVPLDEGIRLAQSTDQILLLNFTAAWCEPCKALDAQVFRNPAFAAEINERFIPVRVVDRQREDGRNSPRIADLERRFTVRVFPTIIFADATGTERGRMEGFRGAEDFRRVMESTR